MRNKKLFWILSIVLLLVLPISLGASVNFTATEVLTGDILDNVTFTVDTGRNLSGLLYYGFDSGSVNTDLTATSYDLTTNQGSSVDGVLNEGLYFDGSEYAYSSSTENFLDTDVFTISFWLKSSDTSAYIYAYGSSGNSDYNTWIYTSSTALYFQHYTATSYARAQILSAPFLDNEWHFMSFVANSTGIYIFGDGELQGSDTSFSSVSALDNNQFGFWGKINGASPSFIGSIDEASIFLDDLTQEEINILMNFGPSVLGNDNIVIDDGFYNVTASKTGYFPKVQEIEVVGNASFNVFNLSDSLVDFSLFDILTSDVVVVPSYLFFSGVLGDLSFSSVNGSFSDLGLLSGSYDVVGFADDYAVANGSFIVPVGVSSFNLSLYANNSVWITAFDQSSGSSLSNFSVNVFNEDFSYDVNDNDTGIIYLDNVTSGFYTVRVDKDGYATSDYSLSVTGGSHQDLVSYLIVNGSQCVFTVVDSVSGGIIEGASVSIYGSVDGVWTLLSSQLTDITGRSEINYLPNVQYKFVIDAVGYSQRDFLLKPLFSTYTVRLTPDVSGFSDVNVGDYVYFINNSGVFFDGVNNSVSISLSSGTGSIEFYTLNVSNFDGSVSSFYCSNSYGCVDSLTLEIIDALFNDSVVVEYWIKEVGRSEKYFRKVYYVQGTYNQDTLFGWRDVDDDQLDDPSRALLVTIICLIVVGVVSLGSVAVGAPPVTVSGVVLGVLMEVFVFVDFIPSMAGHLVALGCLLIVLFGRGEL